MTIQNAKHTACTSQAPISQRTILAMLRAPSVLGAVVGAEAQYIDPTGRTGVYRIAVVGNNTVGLEINGQVVTVPTNQIRTNQPPVFLDKLLNSQWSVTSFDPKSRIACIQIYNGKITENITVTLPSLR